MSATFSKTAESMPKELHSSSIDSLTYNNGKIKLSFKLVDENSSMNFTYTYTSTITYEIG